jgi:hypothetical protein
MPKTIVVLGLIAVFGSGSSLQALAPLTQNTKTQSTTASSSKQRTKKSKKGKPASTGWNRVKNTST